jgi:hypothetical protein
MVGSRGRTARLTTAYPNTGERRSRLLRKFDRRLDCKKTGATGFSPRGATLAIVLPTNARLDGDVRGQKTDSDLLINHEALVVRCFLVADPCHFRLRVFMGRRFTLRLVRPAKRLLHRTAGFALVSSTRPLRSACDRYCRSAAPRLRSGCACVSVQSKWRINRASGLHRTRVAERFLHSANRITGSWSRNGP